MFSQDAHRAATNHRTTNLSQQDSEDHDETAFFRPQKTTTTTSFLSTTAAHPTTAATDAYDSTLSRTPPRVLSSSSLYGEDIVNSSRFSTTERDDDDNEHAGDDDDGDGDLLVSPTALSPSEPSPMNTPPSINTYASSPPLLLLPQQQQQQQTNMENLSWSSARGSIKRPPRAPNVNLRFKGSSVGGNGSVPEKPSFLTPHYHTLPPPVQNHPLFHNQQQQQHHDLHRRSLSTGDVSLLSALTDSSFDAAGAPPGGDSGRLPPHFLQHLPHLERNSISSAFDHYDGGDFSNTGGEVRGMNIDIPLELQQPILQENNFTSIASPVPVEFLPSPLQRSVKTSSGVALSIGSTMTSLGTQQSRQHHLNLHLQEITKENESFPLREFSQYETEAETLLLKAIENELMLNERLYSSNNKNRRTSWQQASTPLHVSKPNTHSCATKVKDEKTASILPKSRRRRLGGTTTNSEDLAAATTHLSALQKLLEKHDVSENYFIEFQRSLDKQSCSSLSSYCRLLNSVSLLKQSSMSGHRKRSSDATTVASSDDGDREETKVTGRGNPNMPQHRPTGMMDVSETMEPSVHHITKTEADKWRPWTHCFRDRVADAAINAPLMIGHTLRQTMQCFKDCWNSLDGMVTTQRAPRKHVMMNAFGFVVLPSLLISLFFYHIRGITSRGNLATNHSVGTNVASTNGWLLHLGVRNVLALSLALATEFVIMTALSRWSPRFMRRVHPMVGLSIAQSQGWPCISFFFGLFNLILNYSHYLFSEHWLLRHPTIQVASASPSGELTASQGIYLQCIIMFIFTGLAATAKRLWIALHLSRRLCDRYQDQITDVLRDVILLSEIALFSKGHTLKVDAGVENKEDSNFMCSNEHTGEVYTGNHLPPSDDESSPAGSGIDISCILEEWEEPPPVEKATDSTQISVKNILQFHQSVLLLRADTPFSPAFGPASTRETCIESATTLYNCLLQRQQDQSILKFETLCEIIAGEGSLDKVKARKLVRLWRPDRERHLSPHDFIAAVDGVYRKLRFLDASIETSAHIDSAYEAVVNWVFYGIIGCIVLSILGVNIVSFIFSVSSITIAVAIMTGTASSNYFEGILFVLVKRPYDIGDRISFSNSIDDADQSESKHWIVEKIGFLSTTLRNASTRQVATNTNGCMARSPIVNMNRSGNAQIKVLLKFRMNASYERMKVFRKALEAFVKERPREWTRVPTFRGTRAEPDLGFIEYTVTLQHREAWQKFSTVMESKAALTSFCVELQKRLNLRCSLPAYDGERINTAIPVQKSSSNLSQAESRESFSSLARLFEPNKTK